MPISDRLSRRLYDALGEEAGGELMTWMRQLDGLPEFRQEMRADVGDLRTEVGTLRAEVRTLRADVAELRQEMQVGFATLRLEMAQMETRLERRIADLIKWSFVFWVGAVGAIAMLARVLG